MQFTAIGWHYHDGRAVIQHITAETVKEAQSIASVCLGRMRAIGSGEVSLEHNGVKDVYVGSEDENWSVTLINGIVEHIPRSGIGDEIILPAWDDVDGWEKLVKAETGVEGAKFLVSVGYDKNGFKILQETIVNGNLDAIYPYKITTKFPKDRFFCFSHNPKEKPMADEQIEVFGSTHPKQMSDDEYVDNSGDLCPFCRENDVHADGFEPDGGGAWRQCKCGSCGKEWTETYNLVGYSEIEE